MARASEGPHAASGRPLYRPACLGPAGSRRWIRLGALSWACPAKTQATEYAGTTGCWIRRRSARHRPRNRWSASHRQP